MTREFTCERLAAYLRGESEFLDVPQEAFDEWDIGPVRDEASSDELTCGDALAGIGG